MTVCLQTKVWQQTEIAYLVHWESKSQTCFAFFPLICNCHIVCLLMWCFVLIFWFKNTIFNLTSEASLIYVCARTTMFCHFGERCSICVMNLAIAILTGKKITSKFIFHYFSDLLWHHICMVLWHCLIFDPERKAVLSFQFSSPIAGQTWKIMSVMSLSWESNRLYWNRKQLWMS